MNPEKIVMWKDPERDEDKEEKSKNLVEHVDQYGVELIMAYDWMPMILVKVTAEQAEKLAEDEELVVEDNGIVYALSDVLDEDNAVPGKPRNCS